MNAAATAGNSVGSGNIATGLSQAALVVGGGVIGKGLRFASAGIKGLFAEGGGLAGKTIIGIRETLVKNGFKMSLAENGKGYLFKNAAGEEVRVMRDAAKGWYVRIKNSAGNYLDANGNPGGSAATHLPVTSR